MGSEMCIRDSINTDKAHAYGVAIAALKKDGLCPKDTLHRYCKYLNNIIEGDHARLKRLIRPTLGFISMKTAYATIKGFEVMRAIKKGQAKAGQIQKGVQGEIRLIESAFGIGKCALAEAIDVINEAFVNDPDLEQKIIQNNQKV